jgi:hypothetical protein
MRSTRMLAGIALILSVVALPGGAMGQSADDRPADGDTTPVYVTWTGAYGYSFPLDVEPVDFPWGTRTFQGIHVTQTADDPRVSGEVIELIVGDGELLPTKPDQVSRFTSLMRIENDEGAWQGPLTTVLLPDYLQITYGWLKGEGAYEGLSFFTSYRDDTASDIHKGEGMIWPGDPPPVPDPTLLDAAPQL